MNTNEFRCTNYFDVCWKNYKSAQDIYGWSQTINADRYFVLICSDFSQCRNRSLIGITLTNTQTQHTHTQQKPYIVYNILIYDLWAERI